MHQVGDAAEIAVGAAPGVKADPVCPVAVNQTSETAARQVVVPGRVRRRDAGAFKALVLQTGGQHYRSRHSLQIISRALFIKIQLVTASCTGSSAAFQMEQQSRTIRLQGDCAIQQLSSGIHFVKPGPRNAAR